jgi:hypothetical protein
MYSTQRLVHFVMRINCRGVAVVVVISHDKISYRGRPVLQLATHGSTDNRPFGSSDCGRHWLAVGHVWPPRRSVSGWRRRTVVGKVAGSGRLRILDWWWWWCWWCRRRGLLGGVATGGRVVERCSPMVRAGGRHGCMRRRVRRWRRNVHRRCRGGGRHCARSQTIECETQTTTSNCIQSKTHQALN